MPKKAGRVKKDTRVNEVGNSYVHVVKGQMQPKNKESKATPALEGNNVSIGSWFSQLKQASVEFNTEGRIAWVEVKGIFGFVPKKLQDGFLISWKKMMIKNRMMMVVLMYMNRANHSGDPFSIYKLLNQKKDNVEKENNSEHSMKYPPGFTPKEGTDVVGMHTKESDNIVNMSDHNAEEVNNNFSGNCTKKNSKEDVSNLVCLGHFKTSMVPRTGGSILSLMDKLVKVGQVMGYKMDGCLAQKAKKDWVKELCVKNKENFLALQETKMENMELFSVKMCWGNFAFDYVHSDSVDEIEIDENLHFVEEPIEIVERDVKNLKRRRIPLVKIRWNSRQGAEYTWEREDQFWKKYQHMFTELLAPRYVGPFEIVKCVGPVAYRLKLPQELSCVHDTFHVSNLKKCLAEPDVQVPLDEIEIDENLHFVEDPIEIVERDVKKLKRRRIPLVNVH
nr:reverse transcriptase domain-containing protein [Tanacetum cinerariifolium]